MKREREKGRGRFRERGERMGKERGEDGEIGKEGV